MLKTCITASYVLGHADGGHVLIRNGEVVYEDDTILYVGGGYTGQVDKTVDLGDSLLTPGLIDLDALTDIDHLLLDSWADSELSLGHGWSEDYFNHRRHDVFSPEDRQFIREYALVQLALHGITTYMPIAAETHSAWAETYDELVGMSQTSRQLGLRGYLGPAYRAGVNVVRSSGGRDVLFDEDLGEAGFQDALRFLNYASDLEDPLVNGVLLPCRIETMTESLLQRTAAAAVEHSTLVRLHCLQGMVERQLIQQWYGLTPLELLERTDLLNQRLLIPHGLLTDRNSLVHGEDRGDLDTLATAGVSVIHCPQTTFRYGKALETFGVYRDAGINLCLGTDSFPPDLIRGMDTGVHLAKILEGRTDAAPAEHYFDAATLGGAQALGRTDLGRLEAGAQADLVAFRMDDIRDGVMDDPVRTLLLNGTARHATHSVVAGRTVMSDGKIQGIDVDRMRARAQELFDRMREAYSGRDWKSRSADELFPPTYPVHKSQTTELGTSR